MKIYRFNFIVIVMILMTSINFAQENGNNYQLEKLFKDLPFEMKPLSIPNFPDKNYNIVDFGAVGDGLTLNTEAINKSIIECSKNGGGKVVVPAGIWLTGPILFKSNVNLYLEQGALIQFSKDYNLYPIIESNWEGVNQYRCTSPLMANGAENIAITGKGIIDGGGDAWRYVKKEKLTDRQWMELIRSGGVVDESGRNWWPTKEAMEAPRYMAKLRNENKPFTKTDAEKYKVFFRPVMLNFVECKNIWLDGVTFQNSPAWNLHPFMSENVILTNVTVRNPWYSQNGDGIDVESCKNVLIYKSNFDVGDDAICMKSGKDEEGRKRGKPTENILIQDCIVFHGHGGFTIGSEMSGGIKNIKVDNCNFIGTDVGLRFKSTRGRGGVVENIYISNIYMNDIPTDAISFNMYYGGAAPTDESSAGENKSSQVIPVDEGTPSFRKIYLNNILCVGARDAVVLQGLPEMAIQNIELSNITMTARRGISIFDADGIKIKNAVIKAESPIVNIYQGKNVLIDNFTPETNGSVVIKLSGAKSENIVIKGGNAETIKNAVDFGDEVSKNILKVD